MFRPILGLFAIAVAAPVSAASYSAALSTPTSQRIIARDIVWNCGPVACQGSSEESRPVVLCQSLAKRAGHIDSFLVDGRAFTPSELDRCNTSARQPSGKALAAQQFPPRAARLLLARAQPLSFAFAFRACTRAPLRPILGACFGSMNWSRRFAPTIPTRTRG